MALPKDSRLKCALYLTWVITLVVAFNLGTLLGTWDRHLQTGNVPVLRNVRRTSSAVQHIMQVTKADGAYPVDSSHIAILVNTAEVEEQWRRNYKQIFSVWGEDLPFVFWFSNFTFGVPPRKPHVIACTATGVAERYMAMVGCASFHLPSHIKWVITVDEDTFLFIDNLLDLLGEYDSSQFLYIGDISEDSQAVDWYTRMAFGGGAVALSRPLVDALAGEHDFSISSCISRYERIDTGDEKLSRCIADFGIPLTQRAGFHQLDIRGDVRPVLQYAFSRSPIISYHHVYAHIPVFLSEKSSLAGMKKLFSSYKAHANMHREFLALFFIHSTKYNVTVAYNVGLSVRVWFGMIPSRYFAKFVPELHYHPWQPRLGKGFSTFETERVVMAFHCESAAFEWAAPLASEASETQRYARIPAHPDCVEGGWAADEKALLDVSVTHVPCGTMSEPLAIKTLSASHMALQAVDCRSDFPSFYSRTHELDFREQ